MTVLYIASDRSGAGKTALCASLASILAEDGLGVGVIKPLSGANDADTSAYESLLGAAPVAAAQTLPEEGVSPEIAASVHRACAEAQDGKDVLVVEGASGLAPKDHARLAEELDATVVIVVRFAPEMDAGPLAAWSEQLGDRLLGFVINGLTRYQERDVTTRLLPAMDAQGLNFLGAVPEDRRMLGVSVAQLAEHLGGRYLAGRALADGLVEHFMVGGMGLDSGLDYFGLHESKAAIIRGDRPDIQMACLQTPTTCMVLTGGIAPIEYVLNEAGLEEVPIVVTESDTLGTMEALNSVQDRARFDHTAKLERFSELLLRHADLDAIRARLAPAA